MSLPDGTCNSSQTFYPFKRLPIELRCMVWRASLRPRVVRLTEILSTDEGFDGNGYVNKETDEHSIEAMARLSIRRTREKAIKAYLELDHDNASEQADDRLSRLRTNLRPRRLVQRRCFLRNQHRQHKNVLCNRCHTFIQTILPAALYACRESREAVLPLYPLCFASATHPRSTRFNLSLDILCITRMSIEEIADLLGALRPMEMSRLSNLAIEERWAMPHNAQYREAWVKLVNKLTGLKNILVFRDLLSPLQNFVHYVERRRRLLQETASFDRVLNHVLEFSREIYGRIDPDSAYNRVDLYDDFPDGIFDGMDFKKLSADIPQLRLEQNQAWLPKKTKMVWALPRLSEPGCHYPGAYHPSR